MIQLSIPGREDLTLYHAVFDVNGTLATDGILIEGVAQQLEALAGHLDIHLLTADTHGRQAELDAQLGLTAHRIPAGQEREQKAAYVQNLGAQHVVAIGNGGNDVDMLQTAAIGIAVVGAEGLSVEAMIAADVLVPTVADGLDLLLKPKRLIATLRR